MTKTLEMGQEKDKIKGLGHEKEKRKKKGKFTINFKRLSRDLESVFR